MATIVLNINTNEVVRLTGKLEKLHKSALPAAVRDALSRAALHAKKESMPDFAEAVFKKREKNFFKANSKVEFAKGFNVNKMKSTVGFVSTNLKGKDNYAVKDLEAQEKGGSIDGRSLLPLNPARKGNSSRGKVRLKYQTSLIKNAVNANKVKAQSPKQRFIRAAIMAKKLYSEKAFVIGNRRQGRMTISKIDRVSSNIKSKQIEIKRTPIYSVVKGFKVKAKAKHFMQRASMKSGEKIYSYFIQEAQRQFERLQK